MIVAVDEPFAVNETGLLAIVELAALAVAPRTLIAIAAESAELPTLSVAVAKSL